MPDLSPILLAAELSVGRTLVYRIARQIGYKVGRNVRVTHEALARFKAAHPAATHVAIHLLPCELPQLHITQPRRKKAKPPPRRAPHRATLHQCVVPSLPWCFSVLPLVLA